MARPRSDDKRKTLLAAATRVFAAKGLTAPTAAITSEAGCAEGTLFVYFKGKDDLINTLYGEIKCDLAKAMHNDFPKDASIRERMHHIWNGYLTWGVDNPDQLAALHKIKVWEGLRPDVRDATSEQFEELLSLMKSVVEGGVFADTTEEFVIAALSAQAEFTMTFMRKYPEQSSFYREKGFEMFWNGLARKY